MPEAQPTPDQSWCEVPNGHRHCTGYTEDHKDPETCFCPCHNEWDI